MNELCYAKVQATNEELNGLEEKINEVEVIIFLGRHCSRSTNST